MATITLGSSTYTLITLPGTPGFVECTFTMEDSVAVVESPYDPAVTQTQTWPGADRWSVQFTLPKMTQQMAGQWRGFLAALRGRQNVFQIGDPAHKTPCGRAMVATGGTTPLVDGTVSGGNARAATILYTKGWAPGIYRQLLAGDYLQIGYRLYMVTGEVDSDSGGKAAISIFPSLRETPADGTVINLVNPVGVFRLTANMRQWHTTLDHLTQASFQAREQK